MSIQTSSLPAGATVLDLSNDGRYVSYTTVQNGIESLWVLQLGTGTTTFVDSETYVDHSITGASGIDDGVLSADGRFIFYAKGTLDGFGTPTGGSAHLLVKDLASAAPAVEVAVGRNADDISADGSRVLYSVDFIDSPGIDVVNFEGYVVEDILTGAEARLNDAPFTNSNQKLTPDGRFVAINQPPTTQIYDLQQHTLVVVNGSGFDSSVAISNDGRYVAYSTSPLGGVPQVYVRDLVSGTDTIVSTSSEGVLGNAGSYAAQLSGDGRHLAFFSDANNLVPGDTDGIRDLFIKDLVTGAVVRIGPANGSEVLLSDDGSVVLNGATLTTFLPPSISISTISGDNYVNAVEALFPVTVTGTSDAIGGTVHVTSPNGATATAQVQADGTWTANFVDVTGVAQGSRTFTADVTDDFGIDGVATKSATFDFTPPSLILLGVAGDNIVARSEASSIVIDGTSDAIGHDVTLSFDHHVIGHATVAPNGEWYFVYDGRALTDGQHEIEFSVADDAGNVNERSIYFDKVTPANVAPTFFIGGGYVDTPIDSYARATSLAIGDDGRIVVGGAALLGDFNSDLISYAAVRYEADGKLDTTFGTGGIVVTEIGYANSVAVEPDGATILGGRVGGMFGLERLDANGALDPTFGTGGIVWTVIGSGGSDGIAGIVVDGTRIIAAGGAYAGVATGYDFALARYLADGSLDPTFGIDGTVTTDFGSPVGILETARSVALQADGKIVVGGLSSTAGYESVFSLARYNSDGTLDTTFADHGQVVTQIGTISHPPSLRADFLSQVRVQADGKILAVGSAYDGEHFDVALVRYNQNGSLDSSFSADGKLVTEVISQTDVGASVALQADGKIVVGGYLDNLRDNDPAFNANAYSKFMLVRYNANGTLDTTFGDAGVVTTEIGDNSSGVAVEIDADGKIVLAGTAQGFAVARYNSDGSLDPQFGGTNSLGNTVNYIEGGPAVVLDAGARIYDADLAALVNGAGNYGGASVTLARVGGANGEDVFGTSGALAFVGGNVVLAGTLVGSLSQSSGQVTITFAPGSTQTQVDGVLGAITYANSSDAFVHGTTTPLPIGWTFSDGNSGVQGTGGAKTTSGITLVDVIAPNHIPVAADFTRTIGKSDPFSAQLSAADLDNDPLTFSVVGTAPAGVVVDIHGGLTVTPQPSDLTMHYGESRVVTFQYVANDGFADSTPRTVTVTIAGVDADVLGTAGDDPALDGTDHPDTIRGLGGHDHIDGKAGDDNLYGNDDPFAQESDVLIGGEGDDTIFGEFTDTIDGGPGNDTLIAVNSYDWTIDLATTGIEVFVAAWGNDTIDATAKTAGVVVFASGGDDSVLGSDASASGDMIWLGVGDDIAHGNGGDDVIIGEGGADHLFGDAGNDSLYVDDQDTFDGGSGFDAVYITVGSGMTIDMGATQVEWVGDYAGGADHITAATGTDVAVFAGGGDDEITGLDGNDFLWGEAGADVISGGSGSDTLVGGTGADTLEGGSGTDNIFANSGGGGDGAVDTIVFDAPGWGVDFVYDFEQGTDKIDMRGSGAAAGALAITNVDGHAYVSFGGVDLIVVVNQGTALAAGDFVF